MIFPSRVAKDLVVPNEFAFPDTKTQNDRKQPQTEEAGSVFKIDHLLHIQK